MTLLEAATQEPGGLEGWILTIVTFLPLAGALIIGLFLPADKTRQIKGAAVLFTLLTALASLLILFNFDSGYTDGNLVALQMVQEVTWMPSFGIKYHMGVDGISLVLVILTTMLTPLVMLSSSASVSKKVKEYFVAMLVLETGMIGSFCAFDMFLFYVFFELMLIPMYLLIGVWGGANRIYAAVKFFIYTLVGSLLMFVGILYCYSVMPEGANGFSIVALTEQLPGIWAQMHEDGMTMAPSLVFLAFMLSFAIKTPVFPFHTWLPDAHTEAPTGGSVILAGVLLKLGTYGMLRFGIGFFPAQAYEWAPLFVALAVIGIIYGAMMAIAQDDLKKLVAYSSVSHLGFVVLGIFAFTQMATEGALLQNVNHGLSTGLLFLCVGMVYDRRHTRLIEDYGGIAKVMPKFAVVFMIATLASIGLPGLNGFVGEFYILLGSFGADTGTAEATADGAVGWTWMKTAVLLAGSGIILGAVYMLWAYQRVIFGPITHEENKELKDMTKLELGYCIPIIAACFIIGVMPGLVTDPMVEPVERYVERMDDTIQEIRAKEAEEIKEVNHAAE